MFTALIAFLALSPKTAIRLYILFTMKSTIYIHFCQTSTCDLSNARNKSFALNQNRQVVPLVAIGSPTGLEDITKLPLVYC